MISRMPLLAAGKILVPYIFALLFYRAHCDRNLLEFRNNVNNAGIYSLKICVVGFATFPCEQYIRLRFIFQFGSEALDVCTFAKCP